MKLGFASPAEALTHISETPWSNWTKADYTLEQWHAACLIHTHDGEPTSKSECKLPVKTPDGSLNRNGVHAAAAALAGARGGLKGVSAEQKTKAANALKRYYSQLDEDPPESLAEHSAVNFREKPGSPQDILEHYGTKGMRWGVRKKEETSAPDLARVSKETKARLTPGTPEFQNRVRALTRTDKPQVLSPQRAEGGRVGAQKTREAPPEKSGLTSDQKKLLIGAGVGVAAIGGYVAYKHYVGNTMPGLDLNKLKQEERLLEGVTIPKSWDVSGLKHGPLSTQRLGDLAGGDFNAKLKDSENLVVNASRGFADILPKDGFDRPFATKQHDSVISAVEAMREKFPAVRNMNIEVVPMSKVPGMEGSSALQAVMSMRAGEARVMYNDLIDEPGKWDIRANKKFLPGLGTKDYLANHEMGHLLAAAHGDLPPSFDLLTGKAGPAAMKKWQDTEPLLHRRTLARHGFTFKELSKLSGYAATQPAEAMAELAGHYFTPEMRTRLTPSQITRAEALFNEMGGLG